MQSLEDALSPPHPPTLYSLSLCCWKELGVGIVDDGQSLCAMRASQLTENPADSGFNRFELAALPPKIVHPREVWHSLCLWSAWTSLMATMWSADGELRTGAPLRGVTSASPLRPPAHRCRAGRAPPEGQLSGGGFCEEVRSQSPHLSNLLHGGVVAGFYTHRR